MLFPRLQYIELALFACVSAVTSKTCSHLLPTHRVFQFDQTGTWIENIAVRPNGDLLVSLLQPTASLYTLARPNSSSREFSLLHTFDNASSLLGITETHPDTYAILSIQFSETLSPVPGSATIWDVSFDDDKPLTRKITNVPDVLVPNGIASVPGSPVVFVADSTSGTITRCDTRAAACTLFLNTPQTAPAPGSSRPTGVNGIHYRRGYLYWSNSNLVSIFRVRLGDDGYLASDASVETVGTVDATFIDDFAIDDDGRFWIAAASNNAIVALRGNGSSEVVAGALTELTVAGPTSAAFGRTARDRETLYVVTNGASSGPVNGITEPAKIVAVDTSGFV
ncbi:hypothetical protein F5Y14DRAFT_62588 [Nemania sp. NC0429]|nr:hypothetical protein F5Y14DRAFT_62588 [Nemania sp. NC0429]